VTVEEEISQNCRLLGPGRYACGTHWCWGGEFNEKSEQWIQKCQTVYACVRYW